jgi:hypothetical protein
MLFVSIYGCKKKENIDENKTFCWICKYEAMLYHYFNGDTTSYELFYEFKNGTVEEIEEIERTVAKFYLSYGVYNHEDSIAQTVIYDCASSNEEKYKSYIEEMHPN